MARSRLGFIRVSMLARLSIRDIVLIERLDIEFSDRAWRC